MWPENPARQSHAQAPHPGTPHHHNKHITSPVLDDPVWASCHGFPTLRERRTKTRIQADHQIEAQQRRHHRHHRIPTKRKSSAMPWRRRSTRGPSFGWAPMTIGRCQSRLPSLLQHLPTPFRCPLLLPRPHQCLPAHHLHTTPPDPPGRRFCRPIADQRRARPLPPLQNHSTLASASPHSPSPPALAPRHDPVQLVPRPRALQRTLRCRGVPFG